eukprot:Hpha_TRINITY_DN17481_c0_g1::TRINITY_DN17481_c0_g1_i1::g.85819::m.85819
MDREECSEDANPTAVIPLASIPLVSVESIAALCSKKQVLPALAKPKGKAKGRGGGRGKSAAEPPTCEDEVFLWEAHPSVGFVVFESRPVLRKAAGRLSVYLEDPKDRGTVLEETAQGHKHKAAGYTGHNFRPEDLDGFVAAAEEAGVALVAEEERLREAVRRLGKASPGLRGMVAISRGLGSQEAQETALHEAHHGLFYTYPEVVEGVQSWWEASSEERRIMWRGFLAAQGYDVEHSELVLNELFAYMCTEKRLFNRGAGGGSGGDDLLSMQADFKRDVAGLIPTR